MKANQWISLNTDHILLQLWTNFTCVNCHTVGAVSNGFHSGPESIRVIDPNLDASFSAGCSLDDSRGWGERGTWEPVIGRWVRND